MALQRKSTATARLLKSLEARLISLDEGLLLTAACFVVGSPTPREEPGPKHRLGFHRVEPPALEPARPRLRFIPLPPELDRVIIQNFNAHTGFVPIGDVELELDPGQAVTLWINRASPTPRAGEPGPQDVNSSLVILAEQQSLLV